MANTAARADDFTFEEGLDEYGFSIGDEVDDDRNDFRTHTYSYVC
jgi:hypothetical protein